MEHNNEMWTCLGALGVKFMRDAGYNRFMAYFDIDYFGEKGERRVACWGNTMQEAAEKLYKMVTTNEDWYRIDIGV